MLASEPIALRATGTDGPAAVRLPMKTGGFDPGSAQISASHAQQLGRDLAPDDATGCEEERPPPRNGTSPNSLRVAGLCESVRNHAKRRARDSNPQPVARHLISSRIGRSCKTLNPNDLQRGDRPAYTGACPRPEHRKPALATDPGAIAASRASRPRRDEVLARRLRVVALAGRLPCPARARRVVGRTRLM